MLPIFPPFQAEHFADRPGSPPPWGFVLAAPFGLPVLTFQTLWARKVVRNFSVGSGVYGAEISASFAGVQKWHTAAALS
jgi:hypothetical protein